MMNMFIRFPLFSKKHLPRVFSFFEMIKINDEMKQKLMNEYVHSMRRTQK